MKKNLYITRRLKLHREGNVLKIDNTRVPVSMIDSVFIIGNAKITRSAKSLLLKNSKSIFYLSGTYKPMGLLMPHYFVSSYRYRLKQYKNLGNLDIAKFIIGKKIDAIEQVTKRSMQRYKDKLESCKSLNEVLGVEGSASSYMFEKFKSELKNLGIENFTRDRKSKDIVNSVLNFIYTLYYSFTFSLIVSEELDPYIGFLHIKRGTHAALASDIMEEARVYLTFMILEFLSDIELEDGYLTGDSVKLVLKRFDEFILNYENSLIKEIKEML